MNVTPPRITYKSLPDIVEDQRLSRKKIRKYVGPTIFDNKEFATEKYNKQCARSAERNM